MFRLCCGDLGSSSRITWPIFKALSLGIPAAAVRAATNVASSSGRLSWAFAIHLSDAKLLPMRSSISRAAVTDPLSHNGLGRIGAGELAESLTKDESDAGTLNELTRLD